MAAFQPLQVLDAIRDARAQWLGAPERLVLVMLVLHSSPDGIAWCPQSKLAEETDISERRVWSALRTLVCEAVIDLVEAARQHHAARYSLRTTAARLRAEAGAALKTARPEPSAGLRQEPPAALKRQARKGDLLGSQNERPRVAPGAAEGSEGSEERESARTHASDADAAENEKAFAMPTTFPLTEDARAHAEKIGVDDPAAEWEIFRAYQIREGRARTAAQWYAGAWPKWCFDAKRFQSAASTRDAARTAASEASAERPYHQEAKLPLREAPLTDAQKQHALAAVKAIFEPAKVST